MTRVVFAIAAIALAVRRLREHERIESIEGPCPACGEPQSFPPPLQFTVLCLARRTHRIASYKYMVSMFLLKRQNQKSDSPHKSPPSPR